MRYHLERIKEIGTFEIKSVERSSQVRTRVDELSGHMLMADRAYKRNHIPDGEEFLQWRINCERMLEALLRVTPWTFAHSRETLFRALKWLNVLAQPYEERGYEHLDDKYVLYKIANLLRSATFTY